MGSKIEEARTEFETLVSTRRNQLERPLKQIEQIRTEKGINIELLPEEGEETTDTSESQ